MILSPSSGLNCNIQCFALSTRALFMIESVSKGKLCHLFVWKNYTFVRSWIMSIGALHRNNQLVYRASSLFVQLSLKSFVFNQFSSFLVMSTRRSSDFARFKELFDKSKRIVALTGAGVSAESGVPTFRGEGGLWRRYQATSLATPQAFASDPSLVWQFYEYRRQLVATKVPNDAHKTLAYIESQFKSAGSDRTINIITQNVDELHRRAGTTNLLEIHGTLYKTRCTKCKKVESNNTNPIVPSLANISPIDNDESKNKRIAFEDLPHCGSCGAMLRPHIVWFNESLDPEVLNEADQLLAECDLFLVIGTSSIVYPAAMFAPQVASRGVTVAEFNLEPTSASKTNGYFFEGPCGQTLPKALGVDVNQLN